LNRNSFCLNGEWDFMPVYGVKSCLELPNSITYEGEKIRVPSSWRYVTLEGTPYYSSGFGRVDDFQPFNLFEYPEEWSRADTAVYHRTFAVPGDMQEGRVYLRFDGMSQRARVYLNGNFITDWEESYLPLRVDVTGHIRRNGEENDIQVVCTTFEEVQLPSGQPKVLGLIGSWFGNMGRGIWQDVYLESTPSVYIGDVVIQTSVRKQSIAVKTAVENKSGLAGNIDVQVRILEQGTVVKSFESSTLRLDSDGTAVFELQESWENPIYWDIENPFLYGMQIDLRNESGILDSRTLRFGFREIWSEGHTFILNGVRINLRGDSWHFQGAIQQTKQYALNWFAMCKENGLNFIRLHAEPHPEYYLDAADEIGMLLVDETAIYGSAKSMPADHPVYLDMCMKHVERLVKRDRNHPSVITWSLQNEMRWVDGRDTYKLHIPEMLERIHQLDGTRPIIVEGDNRLLPLEETEIESRHYNIDGTIAQWDKKRPLIFGEHGGWWYVSPQNSSAYSGLKTYMSFDGSSEGLAIKEKLYVEYCRKADVSGITSFNFAHYLMHSMPDEDILLTWEQLDTPGCKPKVIRKHSLTLNNGLLENYPSYRPGVAMEVLRESYKPVTIISSEYNSSFYDHQEIAREFDVYNDTMQARHCRVEIGIRADSQGTFFNTEFSFLQQPGEKEHLKIHFGPPSVETITPFTLEAVLFHDGKEMHRLVKNYKLYPAHLMNRPLDSGSTRIAYWGGEKSWSRIQCLLPSCVRVGNIETLLQDGYDLLVIGSYLDENPVKYQALLEQFAAEGGVVVQLEQFKFSPGDLTLTKQAFFSTHIGDPDHEILQGFDDRDFIFWKPGTREENPESFIYQSFVKPVRGDVKMLLECSAGDFGDGGDLWTALVEYKYKKGTLLLNQLEIDENYETVPQACLLLRNILKYGLKLESVKALKIGLLTESRSKIHEFLDRAGLQYELLEKDSNFRPYGILVVDPEQLDKESAIRISRFADNGGQVLLLPIVPEKLEFLENLLNSKVRLENKPVYQLHAPKGNSVLSGISIVDLFRYEKVTCSPRMVRNEILCAYSMEVEDSASLLQSVEGTPWFDYYVREKDNEYSKIALADSNRKSKREGKSYLVEKKLGTGRVLLSQLSLNPQNEKDVRFYTRLLSNMGASLWHDAFAYERWERDYAVDYLMTLPHEEYKNYKEAETYYTDPDFSLNNLGEGLYGWMKKVEKSPEDGFIQVRDSRHRKIFMSCFADRLENPCSKLTAAEDKACILQLDINCSFKLWINGRLAMEHVKSGTHTERIIIEHITLLKGLNRLILVGRDCEEDIRVRPVFCNLDGSFMDELKYQLTIDEVDPK
jgi:beta-galactosidase